MNRFYLAKKDLFGIYRKMSKVDPNAEKNLLSTWNDVTMGMLEGGLGSYFKFWVCDWKISKFLFWKEFQSWEESFDGDLLKFILNNWGKKKKFYSKVVAQILWKKKKKKFFFAEIQLNKKIKLLNFCNIAAFLF